MFSVQKQIIIRKVNIALYLATSKRGKGFSTVSLNITQSSLLLSYHNHVHTYPHFITFLWYCCSSQRRVRKEQITRCLSCKEFGANCHLWQSSDTALMMGRWLLACVYERTEVDGGETLALGCGWVYQNEVGSRWYSGHAHIQTLTRTHTHAHSHTYTHVRRRALLIKKGIDILNQMR